MLLEPLTEWFKVVEIDQRNLFGYIDMEVWDEENDTIPLPDMKSWLQVKYINKLTKEVGVLYYEYPKGEKNVERVFVCNVCGTLTSESAFMYGKICIDCKEYKDVSKS